MGHVNVSNSHELEHEAAVLGGVLLDERAFDLADLAAEDFSSGMNRAVFSAMAALRERQDPIDPITLTQEIIDRGATNLFAAAGGVPFYLMTLTEGLPRSVNVGHYSKLVRRHADRRRVNRAIHKMVQRAEDGGEPSELVAYAEAALADLMVRQGSAGRCFRSASEVPGLEGVPDTPVSWLVGGFLVEKSFTVLSGEPGAMKSWIALDVSRSVSEGISWCGRPTQKRQVLYLDRENGASVVSYRRRHLQAEPSKGLHYWGSWLIEQAPALTDRRVLEFASTGGLIVLDSAIRFHDHDENSAQEMAVVSGWIRALVAAGGTVLALFHKSDKGM